MQNSNNDFSMSKARITYIAIFLTIIGLFCAHGLITKAVTVDLTSQIETLSQTIAESEISYNKLNTEFESLSADYEDLQNSYDELVEAHEELTNSLETTIEGISNYSALSSSMAISLDDDATTEKTWSVITPRKGVNQGPNGKETWYNLDMSGVRYLMNHLGYTYEDYPYWVREDGAKMFGDYIMVAADLSIWPKGTILECSLGMAMVVDTGDLEPYQLDIAVNWY